MAPVALSRRVAAALAESAGLEDAPERAAACAAAVKHVLAFHRSIAEAEATGPRLPEIAAALDDVERQVVSLRERLWRLDDASRDVLLAPKRVQPVRVAGRQVVPNGAPTWWTPEDVITGTVGALDGLLDAIAMARREWSGAPTVRRRPARAWMVTVTRLAGVFDAHANRDVLAEGFDDARIEFVRIACRAAGIRIPAAVSRWPVIRVSRTRIPAR